MGWSGLRSVCKIGFCLSSWTQEMYSKTDVLRNAEEWYSWCDCTRMKYQPLEHFCVICETFIILLVIWPISMFSWVILVENVTFCTMQTHTHTHSAGHVISILNSVVGICMGLVRAAHLKIFTNQSNPLSTENTTMICFRRYMGQWPQITTFWHLFKT